MVATAKDDIPWSFPVARGGAVNDKRHWGPSLTQRGRVLSLLVLLAFVAIRVLLDPVLEYRSPFLLFTFAVMVGAIHGGLWISLLIGVVGGAAGLYFLATSLSVATVLTSPHMLQVAIYLAVC